MRIVVALGGNALLRRGEPMTVANQRANVATACAALAPVALEHELVISHGNGPQVGLLALQAAAYDEASDYPFDVLGAQTEGMIGYLIEQELGNLLPFEKPLATILTMTEVDPDDPAFADPTQVRRSGLHRRGGPAAGGSARLGREARRRVLAPGGAVAAAHAHLRDPPGRVAADPGLRRDLRRRRRHPDDVPTGAPAPWSGSRRSSTRTGPAPCWPRDLAADLLVIATDTDAVYVDWGTPEQKAVAAAHPDDLEALPFAAGSMGPKVEAAADFARGSGTAAVIGALSELPALLAGTAGTRVTTAATGVTFRAGG